jgi:hypothetical protein
VKRVIVAGPGAAGKSTLAACLGEITRLPVIELDKLFWRPGLAPTPREEWAAIQRQFAARDSWIMDGDLGPYDVINVLPAIGPGKFSVIGGRSLRVSCHRDQALAGRLSAGQPVPAVPRRGSS